MPESKLSQLAFSATTTGLLPVVANCGCSIGVSLGITHFIAELELEGFLNIIVAIF